VLRHVKTWCGSCSCPTMISRLHLQSRQNAELFWSICLRDRKRKAQLVSIAITPKTNQVVWNMRTRSKVFLIPRRRLRKWTAAANINVTKYNKHVLYLTNTYDHRTLKTRLPVRSALFKQRTGGLVVRWVTTSEYPLLYVFAILLSTIVH
jgi:hypothetical protein